MSGTLVRILLTRHGETESNVEGRFQGHLDSPLTDRGREQGRALSEALASAPLAGIYSSDLGRAKDTAELVAAAHAVRVRTDDRLREIDTGQWSGKLAAELRIDFPDPLERWATQPASMRLPGGESLSEAQERALQFFSQAMPAHLGETVAVVTHGTVGQCILVAAMGRAVQDLWLKQRFDNCQVSRLEWSEHTGLRVIELADTRHLASVGSLGHWRIQAWNNPEQAG